MDTLNAIAYNNEKIREYIASQFENLNLKRVEMVNSFTRVTQEDDVLWIITDNDGTKIEALSYNGVMLTMPKIDLSGYVEIVELGTLIASWFNRHGTQVAAAIPDATQTESGMMSATDKVKLDGLHNFVHPIHPSYTLGLYQIETDKFGSIVRAIPQKVKDPRYETKRVDIQPIEMENVNSAFDGTTVIKYDLAFQDRDIIGIQVLGAAIVNINNEMTGENHDLLQEVGNRGKRVRMNAGDVYAYEIVPLDATHPVFIELTFDLEVQ